MGQRSLILVVEDEADIADLLAFNLRKAGYEVVTAATLHDGMALSRNERLALVLLDLMLPDGSGVELCKNLRINESTSRLPVLMLTAMGAEDDIVAGFEAGADDYVTKPFRMRELLARVEALLKRAAPLPAGRGKVGIGDLELDEVGPKAWLRGEELGLTWTEYKLLRHFLLRTGDPSTREELLRDVWGYAADTETRTVDSHIRRLRSKLKDYEDLVQTVHGVGYGLNHRKYGMP